jgi:hypothetical protein
MISRADRGGRAEDKYDGSLFVPYCTFSCRDGFYELFNKCLCDIEDRICVRMEEWADICLGIGLIAHK